LTDVLIPGRPQKITILWDPILFLITKLTSDPVNPDITIGLNPINISERVRCYHISERISKCKVSQLYVTKDLIAQASTAVTQKLLTDI
jgi:hypothetical protein